MRRWAVSLDGATGFDADGAIESLKCMGGLMGIVGKGWLAGSKSGTEVRDDALQEAIKGF